LLKSLFLIDGLSRVARSNSALDNHPLAVLFGGFLEKLGAKRGVLKGVAASALVPYPHHLDRRHDRRNALRREAFASCLEPGGHAEQMQDAEHWLSPLVPMAVDASEEDATTVLEVEEEAPSGRTGKSARTAGSKGPHVAAAAPSRRAAKTARTAGGKGHAKRSGVTDDEAEEIRPRAFDFSQVAGPSTTARTVKSSHHTAHGRTATHLVRGDLR
jgi:hypothetical protein